MPGKLKFEFASGGYTVLDDGRFIGRVRKVRSTYYHSNGRRYQFWAWAAFKMTGGATFDNRTRAAAVGWLRGHGQ